MFWGAGFEENLLDFSKICAMVLGLLLLSLLACSPCLYLAFLCHVVSAAGGLCLCPVSREAEQPPNRLLAVGALACFTGSRTAI